MINPEKCQCGSVSWERKIAENRYICAICKRPLWQLIETAPKDGENVIVTNGDEVNVGWWEFYNPEPEWGGYILYPTHWMPLPAPPKKGEGKVFPTVFEFYDGLPETWDEAAKLGTITKNEFEKMAAKCFDSILKAQKEKK